MKTQILFVLFFCLLSLASFSQDKIYRNNGQIIEAKVVEISSSEVKYKMFKNQDGPIYVLEADRIKKIVFENGTVQTFQDNIRDPERYAGQRSKAIKLNFFSPLYGYTEIGFEKNIGFGKGYEVSLGVLGAGKSGSLFLYNNQFTEVKRNPRGAFITAGYKFGKLPDFIFFGRSKATHLMQSTYIKPLIYLGTYSENIIVEKSNSVSEIDRQSVTFGALQLELGKQWVLGETILIDIYSGLGFGFDNKKNSYVYYNNNVPFQEDNFAAFNYANARLGRSPGLSYTFGVKLGMLLK
jgi:hypothetical protein